MSRVSDAADVLYGADPEEFVERRKQLAADARAAGDRAAAKEIAALGKPTRSAWLVNRLTREDASVAGRISELGEQLRSGEASLDGASIRKLSVARRELVDSLVRAAVAHSDEPVSAGVRDEIASTLNAALADPDVAGQVAAGTVVRTIQWAGFGPGVGTALDPAAAFQHGPAAAPAQPARAKPNSRASKAGASKADAAKAPAAKAPPEDKRAQQRAAAEQTVAEATEAAEAAAAAERDQQEAVRIVVEQNSADRDRLAQSERDLADAQQALVLAQRAVTRAEQEQSDAEQRHARSRQSLAKERDRLKAAATAARQAAAALKRAQQALDRLP